jgi:hypothetical protein
MEPMRMAQGEHLDDEATHRGPDEVGSRDPQSIQQPGHIVSHLLDGIRNIRRIRLARTTIVESEDSKVRRESRDLAVPEKVITSQARQENNRLSRPVLDIEEVRLVHPDCGHRFDSPISD